VTASEKAQEASYLVAELAAQKRKGRTVGENLIMLAQVGEIENVPLSNSILNRRIDDISHNAEEVLRDKLKNNTFSIQADKSNKCCIVAFVNDGEIQENFFCCKELP
jgi:hypothetical protein